MFALPPDLVLGDGDRVSGISCPACHGSLEVRAEGAGHLHFTCRVGHAVSLREVLDALECFLEDTPAAALRALVEADESLTFAEEPSAGERAGDGA